MLTEPIGPRSPDDILAVVYQRTERTRRRRRQQLSAAVAVVLLGVAAALASLQAGSDEESRVRAVDRGGAEAEEAAASPTTTVLASAVPPAGATKAAPKQPRSSSTGTATDRNGSPAPGTPTTLPPLPTTTLPVDQGPQSRLLAQASDDTGDASLPEWYYDVVSGSMQLDFRSDMVLFATQYATPQGSGQRQSRTLRSEFVFENEVIVVDVTETNNTLGTVRFDGDCEVCTKSFDEAQGRLVVGIPIDLMNEYLTRNIGNGHSIEDAVVSSLTMATMVANEVKADTTGGAQ